MVLKIFVRIIKQKTSARNNKNDNKRKIGKSTNDGLKMILVEPKRWDCSKASFTKLTFKGHSTIEIPYGTLVKIS